MKRIIISVFVGFIIGALISPVAGMAIGTTRNLILGMAPEEAILVLADKIDEESGQNEAQQEIIDAQSEKMSELEKNQKLVACNELRNNCEIKISAIGTSTITLSTGTILNGDRQAAIKKIEAEIKECEKTRDSGEFKSDAVKNAWEKCINNGGKNIAEIKKINANETAEKNDLLNGECKDYQVLCE